MRSQLVLTLAALVASASFGGAQEPKDEPKGDPKKIVAGLVKNIEQKTDHAVRLQAIIDIAEFGPLGEPAVNGIVDALSAKDEDMRLNAAIALGKIGKAAVSPLRETLRKGDEDARFYAIWAL